MNDNNYDEIMENKIDIKQYIFILNTIKNDFNDIYNNGYIERVKQMINILISLNQYYIEFDLYILPKSKIDYLKFDVFYGLTGEIIFTGV